jgi:hypothetical protein
MDAALSDPGTQRSGPSPEQPGDGGGMRTSRRPISTGEWPRECFIREWESFGFLDIDPSEFLQERA